MRTNYVLIDFENVQPKALSALNGEPFKVMVFVGANQTKVSFDTAAALQRMGANAEYIQISGNGANALDFHIAFTIGQLSARDPTAYFHIISKDTGFDPLLKYLKNLKICASRVKSIADIPLLKAVICKSANEKIDLVVARLQRFKAAKPRTVKTLSSTIASLFQKKLSEGEIAALVAELESRGQIAITDTKVTYSLPAT